MDGIKIGKFIAKCRREKKITQAQLAEMLNITNKSVSKWETGCCLPDPSLYEHLCGILGITHNELFVGQRIQNEEGKETADRKFMQFLKYALYSSGEVEIPFHEFDNALSQVAELTAILRSFSTKKEAVDFWVGETGASVEECSLAYDFYINLFQVKD